MRRKWQETVSPKYLHDVLGLYHGQWFSQMDRCWISNDGYSVCSRLIRTDIGKVEHVTITRSTKEASINYDIPISFDGTGDIPWSVKQEIKNELFGRDRIAVEVFPEDSHLVDVCDVYHLWILPKNFKMPFGVHPKDKKTQTINRGYVKNPDVIHEMATRSLELMDSNS